MYSWFHYALLPIYFTLQYSIKFEKIPSWYTYLYSLWDGKWVKLYSILQLFIVENCPLNAPRDYGDWVLSINYQKSQLWKKYALLVRFRLFSVALIPDLCLVPPNAVGFCQVAPITVSPFVLSHLWPSRLFRSLLWKGSSLILPILNKLKSKLEWKRGGMRASQVLVSFYYFLEIPTRICL
jgi:hypothetical protein